MTGKIAVIDRLAATIQIMGCVTELLRLGNPDVAGHVRDALTGLYAQRDEEAANRSSAGRILSPALPPGRTALIEAMRRLEPPRYQRQKADPIGWLIATAKLDQFDDSISLRLVAEYYPPWSKRTERPKSIELRELCEKLVRDPTTRSPQRWHR